MGFGLFGMTMSAGGIYVGSTAMGTIIIGDLPGFVAGSVVFGGSLFGFMGPYDVFRKGWNMPLFV